MSSFDTIKYTITEKSPDGQYPYGAFEVLLEVTKHGSVPPSLPLVVHCYLASDDKGTPLQNPMLNVTPLYKGSVSYCGGRILAVTDDIGGGVEFAIHPQTYGIGQDVYVVAEYPDGEIEVSEKVSFN